MCQSLDARSRTIKKPAIDCYNPPAMMASALTIIMAPKQVLQVLNDWGDDTFYFLRHQVPRIVAILLVAFILGRLLKLVAIHFTELSNRQNLPSSVRSQQIRTLSSVIYSIGLFIILFIAAMQILALLGVNMGPLLASAGVAGVAIGFGAQTLVKDFINGFFILAENQYDIGDTVKIAGVQGVVENMTLRRTVLRDADGTVHTVPSSDIQVVSNLTRDWTQLNLQVSVAYAVDSDKVIALLKQIGDELAHDPDFADLIVATPVVSGIDKVSGNTVEYLMIVKTQPGSQFPVRRELQRRIKASFEKNGIEPGDPSRVIVAGISKPS
jgi:small conductance mechanosensitive channel